jgi:hypothetical protein
MLQQELPERWLAWLGLAWLYISPFFIAYFAAFRGNTILLYDVDSYETLAQQCPEVLAQ